MAPEFSRSSDSAQLSGLLLHGCCRLHALSCPATPRAVPCPWPHGGCWSSCGSRRHGHVCALCHLLISPSRLLCFADVQQGGQADHHPTALLQHSGGFLGSGLGLHLHLSGCAEPASGAGQGQLSALLLPACFLPLPYNSSFHWGPACYGSQLQACGLHFAAPSGQSQSHGIAVVE